MEAEQYDRILARLLDDELLSEEVRDLVDAACRGDAALLEALEGKSQAGAVATKRRPDATTIPQVSLRSIEVRGFRGIGDTAELELQPGPGLTLVIGRNGSGKSSFAEALEMLMTGDCRRWSGKRTVDWKHGWRNIHCTHKPFIRASFAVEGGPGVVVKRGWNDDALDQSTVELIRGDERLSGLDALGWDAGLATFRPFLSYSELATLVEEPSRLYDQLESILGLHDVAAARKRIAEIRKARKREHKATKDALGPLLAQLESSDDPRAAVCHEALSGRSWRLDEVDRVLDHDTDSEAVADIATLQRLSQLEAPPSTTVLEAAQEARNAKAAEDELAREGSAQTDRLARLLGEALAVHEHAPGTCPVCEQALPSDWLQRAAQRKAEAEATASEIRKARERTAAAMSALRAKVIGPPRDLQRCEALGLPTDALQAWQVWTNAPSDPDALIDHVEQHVLGLEEAVTKLRADAATKRKGLADAWQPIARELATWLTGARAVLREKQQVSDLDTAERWLKQVEEDLRNERFEPIAARAQQIWEELRQESSVNLSSIELEKAGNRRKVKLAVTVDEAESVALAVMSQGELNALALSLFLPRMTLPQTPFRFLVIDDPVQAMDPLKVDGLARVLAQVAETRQVVVFTHDTRLPEAIRRLQIPAEVVEVRRYANSSLDVRKLDGPVDRYLQDARALTHSEQELGPKVTARVLPTFCRLAIEAACVATIRRRRIGRGESHEAVATLLEDVKTTNDLVALALFDDTTRGGDVLKTLNNKAGSAATDAYREIRGGAHGGWTGSYVDLVRSAEKLARCLEAEA